MVALRDNKEPSRRECTYKIQVTFLKTKPVLSLAANRGWGHHERQWQFWEGSIKQSRVCLKCIP